MAEQVELELAEEEEAVCWIKCFNQLVTPQRKWSFHRRKGKERKVSAVIVDRLPEKVKIKHFPELFSFSSRALSVNLCVCVCVWVCVCVCALAGLFHGRNHRRIKVFFLLCFHDLISRMDSHRCGNNATADAKYRIEKLLRSFRVKTKRKTSLFMVQDETDEERNISRSISNSAMQFTLNILDDSCHFGDSFRTFWEYLKRFHPKFFRERR